MNLKDILAVSGMSGLFKLMSSRKNGLLVSSLDDSSRTIFCATRKHQFTPMETVAIYTTSDTVELSTILERILDQLVKNPPASPSGSKEEIVNYFSSIVPDYDVDRVYISDMKKVLRWFAILNEKGFLTAAPEADEEE